MVHIGAALAACISSIRWPIAHLLFEMRLPMAQRNWAGIGAAAGVAAAFNAPLGGILYSFEEVCSHWSSKMTWLIRLLCHRRRSSRRSHRHYRGTFPFILYSTVLPTSSLSERPLPAVVSCGSSSWELREVSSGPYTTYAPFTSQECDGGFIEGSVSYRSTMGIVEAVVVSLAIFTVFFCVPSIFRSCRPCSSDDLATGCTGEPSNHRRLASAVDGSGTIHAGFLGLKNRQWTCPFGQYNELATLFHAGQEELVKHLLVRNDVQGGCCHSRHC